MSFRPQNFANNDLVELRVIITGNIYDMRNRDLTTASIKKDRSLLWRTSGGSKVLGIPCYDPSVRF